MPSVLLLSLLFLVAAFAIGLTGFGFGLVAMGVLPYLMDVSDATVLVAVTGLPVTIAGMLPIRRSIDLRRLVPLLIGAAIGAPLGVLFLVRIDEGLVRIVLGAIILLAVGVSLYGSIRTRVARDTQSPPGPDTQFPGGPLRSAGVGLIGVVGGALGGAFSVSGPPVVLYFSQALQDKRAIKASLLAFFTFVIAARLPYYAVTGMLDGRMLLTGLIVMPALVVGLVLGNRLHDRLPTATIRTTIQVLLAVSATLLITGAA